MNSKKQLIWTGVLFLIVGVIFVTAGIIVMKQGDSLKKRCTEETVGTVVELIRERDSDSTTDHTYTYFPVIEYKVGDQTISQKSRSGQNPPKYQVGQQVEIYYNPNNVEEYFIKGDLTPKFFGIGFTALGSIAVAIGFFALIRKACKLESSEE